MGVVGRIVSISVSLLSRNPLRSRVMRVVRVTKVVSGRLSEMTVIPRLRINIVSVSVSPSTTVSLEFHRPPGSTACPAAGAVNIASAQLAPIIQTFFNTC